MSRDLGVLPDDSESLQSRFYRLIEYQNQTQHSRLAEYQTQTQQQLEMYQAQNQRQFGELTSSITKLMETLGENFKIFSKFGTSNNRQGCFEFELINGKNLVVAGPWTPQPDCEQDI
ncbi:hypothetical protein MKW92_050276, partial [Papaver armeniacum]